MRDFIIEIHAEIRNGNCRYIDCLAAELSDAYREKLLTASQAGYVELEEYANGIDDYVRFSLKRSAYLAFDLSLRESPLVPPFWSKLSAAARDSLGYLL